MGDETKQKEVERGNDDPLHATRKPSSAREIEEEARDVAQMPSAEELKRRESERRL